MIMTVQDGSQKVKSNGATTTGNIVCRQGVSEVLRIKGILDKTLDGESESVAVICDLLAKLQYMGLTLNTLEVTGIGKTVNVLRKHASKEVSRVARRLMKEWKDMVEEWLIKTNNKTESCVVNPTNSSYDQQQVMPESLHITYDHKSRVDSSNKANKAKGRVITTDHQESKKVLVRHRLEATNSSIEEKYKMAKRKLQHSYQEAENAKKKRRIRVMELHELSKYKLLPRWEGKVNQSIKPRINRIF